MNGESNMKDFDDDDIEDFEDADFDDDEENYEAFTADELAEILRQEEGLEVEVVEKKKGVKTIHVHCADPSETRKKLRFEVGPDIGIEFVQPRKTKATGFMLQAIQDGTDEMINVKIMKGGTHRAGRKNELDFQKFIFNEIQKNGMCHIDISDNYGKRVELDIVEVIDSAQIHGKDGKVCRTDTTVKLADGSTYGISHKKTNATYVCKVKKMFHEILAGCARVLRQYARENGLGSGDYMDVRITNKELLNLCWFGTDITNGAVFIGNFEGMSSGTQKIERIIEKTDTDVIENFPIYTKWKIKNSAYTLIFCGVSVASKDGKWVVDNVVVPGINAPLPNGKHYVTGNEQRKRRRRRRKKRKTVKESSDEDGRYKPFNVKDIPTTDEIPTKEEIEMGGASFMGTPLKYVPNLHEEANHDYHEYIAVSDKLFNCDKQTQLEILVHEKCHEIAQNWGYEVWSRTIGAAQPFVHKKPKPNDPDEFFFVGITGICGANAVDENFTQCCVWYLLYPEHLKKMSMKFNGDLSAYDAIDNYLRKSGFVNESRNRWIYIERTEDMWDTIAWCAENHKMVWLKYETVDGDIISRRVAPYSYRTRRTKVRGKATYFYGQDFTPGEDNSIKCFLVDNCLQAKKSPTSFSPKFTIEIKQEIDRLEDQRRKEEQEKEKEEQKTKARQDNRRKERDAQQKTKDDMENYRNTPEKPKPKKDDSQIKKEQPAQKVDVVKTSEKPEEPKKPLPPPEPEENGEENNSTKTTNPDENEDEVNVYTTEPENGEGEEDIQITDDKGNVMQENWIPMSKRHVHK